jgi:phytoene/squalene synthetase
MAEESFGNEYVARHMAALLGNGRLDLHLNEGLRAIPVLKKGKALGVATSTALFQKVLSRIKKRLEDWLGSKKQAKYDRLVHKALYGHPWLLPPKGSRIRWEAR